MADETFQPQEQGPEQDREEQGPRVADDAPVESAVVQPQNPTPGPVEASVTDQAPSAPGNPGAVAPVVGESAGSSGSSPASSAQSPNATPISPEGEAPSDAPTADQVDGSPHGDGDNKPDKTADYPTARPDAPPLGSVESLTNENPVEVNPNAVSNTANSPTAPVSTKAPLVTLPQAVRVDNATRRSDADSLEGHWVDIVAGEHQGRRGAFEWVTEYDSKTGYPKTILVRTRDAENELLTVAYEDTRPARDYTGGR